MNKQSSEKRKSKTSINKLKRKTKQETRYPVQFFIMILIVFVLAFILIVAGITIYAKVSEERQQATDTAMMLNSVSASATAYVRASHTPTMTRTAFPPTWTPTFAPTATTQAILPSSFDIQGQVQFVANTFNSSGCQFQGIGGQVLDQNGESYTTPLIVRVSSDSLVVDNTILTGSNPLYGASGFEVQVANSVNNNTYLVQLESQTNISVSESTQVNFSGDCSKNIALVTFVQIREP